MWPLILDTERLFKYVCFRRGNLVGRDDDLNEVSDWLRMIDDDISAEIAGGGQTPPLLAAVLKTEEELFARTEVITKKKHF